MKSTDGTKVDPAKAVTLVFTGNTDPKTTDGKTTAGVYAHYSVNGKTEVYRCGHFG